MDSELLTAEDHHTERVMLGLRLKQGLPAGIFSPAAHQVIDRYIERGLLHRVGGNVAVTDAGRLLADGIIADILLAEDDDLTVSDRKSIRLNSSHVKISYAVFCLKKKNTLTP